MSSILTNNAAMMALQTLRSVNNNLQHTQNAVSSGLRIAKAADNAAYWSIATTMKSDNSAMSAVSDALGLGAAKVDTAYTGMSSAIDVVSQIKAKLVAATEDGVNKGDVEDDISQLQQQLLSVAQSASFNGQNWLVNASGGQASVVSSFIRDASGGVAVQSSSYAFNDTSTGNVLFGADASGNVDTTKGLLGSALDGEIDGVTVVMPSIYSLSLDSSMTAGDISVMVAGVDRVLTLMTAAASKLGSMSNRIDLQTSFVSTLSDSISSGVGKLVDADMESESSQLSALQTQQQLAVQSLSIANSSTQNIMTLFRG